MTTRVQRERLISLDRIDAAFDNDFVAETWCNAYPEQALPADFPSHVRSSARAYLELASITSKGELSLALKRLHDCLIPAIETRDRERAARALEQTPENVVSELRRRFPGKVPSPEDIRQPSLSFECAKVLLGSCVRGAEIVPGRRRPGGRQSRPTLKIIPLYKQRRGRPPQEAEMMLVRSLGEYFYNRDKKFPGLLSHGGGFAPDAGPFARLVAAVLVRCGANSVNPIKLVQRCLAELPKMDPASTNDDKYAVNE
jgi:hypothetical protein